MMGWWDWDSGSWLGMGAWMVVALVIAIVIAWLVIRLAGGDQGRAAPPAPETPDEILRQRFARGEIDAEEYRQRSAVLHET